MRKRSGDVARGHGEILRRLHWRCWDPSAPAPEVSDVELLAVLPMLIGSGSVGVVWPRLRGRFPAGSAVGAALEEAFRSQEAHNARVVEELGRVVARLRDSGVEPVLIKGLAVARLYPAGVLRAAGDIDLVVRDADYLIARDVLSDVRLSFHADPAAQLVSRQAFAARGGVGSPGAAVGATAEVDLHRFSTWYGARDERFFDDAEAVEFGATTGEVPTRVQVPCAEDHLRVLCLHFLRHGAVRPMRLCDIAVMMEAEGQMDWARVLSGTAREVEQIAVVLRLAGEFLGASLDDAPAEVRERALPAWLVPAVLRQWAEDPKPGETVMSELRANPGGIVSTFRRRWPDPITATLRTDARFDEGPRRPVEVAAYAQRVGSFARLALRRPAEIRRGFEEVPQLPPEPGRR